MLTTSANQAEIGLCLLLAAADDDVSTEEIDELKTKIRAMAEEGTSDAVIDAVIDNERGAIKEQGSDVYLERLKDRIAADRREAALRAAADVAFADVLTVEEDKLLRKVATLFGITDKVVDEIAGPPIG